MGDAIADTPQEAENLRLRSEPMDKITALIAQNNWKQAEAAGPCGVTQPRSTDLLRDRISRFSLDALVNIAAALGGAFMSNWSWLSKSGNRAWPRCD